MPSTRTALAAAALAAAALTLPSAAQAHGKPDRAGRGHAKQERVHGHGSKSRGHTVLRGTWSGGSLQVTGGNAAARRAGLVGQTLPLDLAGARIKVHDVDGDGSRDADDVRDGDRVTVQLRGPRGAAGEDLAVRKLVDRGQRDAGDDDAAGDDDPVGSDDPAGDDQGAGDDPSGSDDPSGTDDDPAGTDDDDA